MQLTTRELRRLSGIIKLSRLFQEAGLNPSTMRSAVWSGRELSAEESAAIQEALVKWGIIVVGNQISLFDAPKDLKLNA